MNSEIRITSNKFCSVHFYFGNHKYGNKDHFNIEVFCQANRLPEFHFEKPLLPGEVPGYETVTSVDHFVE